jgi:hypothetical protein
MCTQVVLTVIVAEWEVIVLEDSDGDDTLEQRVSLSGLSFTHLHLAEILNENIGRFSAGGSTLGMLRLELTKLMCLTQIYRKVTQTCIQASGTASLRNCAPLPQG